MATVRKNIQYLNKDFGAFRQNLITFAKNYFPETYSDFNESSPGMMFMEMASYVGDVLSYYTDTSFRESILSLANEGSNILELSQLFGYSPRINSAATCKLDMYHLVPGIGSGASIEPDMRYALSVAGSATFTAVPPGSDPVTFRSAEPVDFRNDPEITVYDLDSSGNVARYLLKKTVDVISGTIQERPFTFAEPKPYDKIVLPDDNVIDIISVTDSAGNKWYHVDYLAQDTIFDDIQNIPFNDPQLSQFRSTVPYILKLRKSPRRFITRMRDDGRTEILFGAGISSDADEEIIPNPKNVGMGLEYLRRTTNNNIDPSNFLYTSTYGLAPSDTTLTVKYSVGGSANDNVGVNTITGLGAITFNNTGTVVDLTDTETTLAVTNPEAAIGGRTIRDLESIRQNAMASFAAQNRAITREDYISRIYAMPTRYGRVEKAFVIGDTQISNDITYPAYTIQNPLALNVYLLTYDENGRFVAANQAIKENLRTYLSDYRMLTDALNLKDAFIINIGIDFEIIVRPSYNTNEVVLACIERLKVLFNNDRMQINGSIDTNALKVELDKVEGVQTVASFEIDNNFSAAAGYSGNVYNIGAATKHGIIYPSLDPCIFEVKFPDQDIRGRSIGL